MRKKYKTFSEFYPFYLSQHSNRVCRHCHFVGSALILLLVAYVLLTLNWTLLLLVPIIGYGFAWAGHLFFEKNKPATFSYPLYSLMGDWVMFKDMLSGNIRF